MSDQENQEPEDDDLSLSDEEYARQVIEAWGKPIPRDNEWEGLKFFRPAEQRAEIMALARGLTMEETLNFYGLIPDVLPDIDALFFVTTFLKGRVKGKSDAVNHLFTNMAAANGSAGVQAAAMYLKQFADSFKDVDTSTGGIRAIRIEVIE